MKQRAGDAEGGGPRPLSLTLATPRGPAEHLLNNTKKFLVHYMAVWIEHNLPVTLVTLVTLPGSNTTLQQWSKSTARREYRVHLFGKKEKK